MSDLVNVRDETVLVTWKKQPAAEGIEGVIALHNALLRGVNHCLELLFAPAGSKSYLRIVVEKDDSPEDVARRAQAVLREHGVPSEATIEQPRRVDSFGNRVGGQGGQG